MFEVQSFQIIFNLSDLLVAFLCRFSILDVSFVPAMIIVVLVACSGCRFLLHIVVSSRASMCVLFLFVASFRGRGRFCGFHSRRQVGRFSLALPVVCFCLFVGLHISVFLLWVGAPVHWFLSLCPLLLPGVFVCRFPVLFSHFLASGFSFFPFLVVFLCPVVAFLCFVVVSLRLPIVHHCPVFVSLC